MEPIREILYANLQELGLGGDEVQYHKCGLERYVFSYIDAEGLLRYRKIVMHPNNKYGPDEGIKTESWLSYLGIGNYRVSIESDHQIIDTPYMGQDLYSLKLGREFWDAFHRTYYTFDGFNTLEIVGGLDELEERLIEFQRLTDLVHVDLFATGRPNNIVWNSFDPRLPALNVIDYESFQVADKENVARFHGRWNTAKEYIFRNLTVY